MLPNPQFPADLVTFTEEILNGKLHFSFSVYSTKITAIIPVIKTKKCLMKLNRNHLWLGKLRLRSVSIYKEIKVI